MNRLRHRYVCGSATRHASNGQSITELALIAPVLIIILLGLVEISGAYGAKIDLQSASFHAARIGALQGNGGGTVFSCPDTSSVITDTVDMNIVQSIISGTAGLNPNNISAIQVFKAGVNGTIAMSGTKPLVNEYKPPFISGTTLITNTYNWPSCIRSASEPADSLGVHVTYNYHPITPLLGRATILMNDGSIQRLNPGKNDSTCPVPGAPTDLVAHYHTDTSHFQPATTDDITWTAVDNATSYKIYAGINGSGVGTTPVYTLTTSASGPLTWSYNFSPPAPAGSQVSYQVKGNNYCGDGDISDPVPDGQYALPITPTILAAVPSTTTPGSDYISWTAVSDAQFYTITQTASTGATVPPITVTAPMTSVLIADPYHTPAVSGVTYQVAATSLSNAVGPAATSSTLVPSAAPITTVDDPPALGPSQFGYGPSGNNWVHCNSTNPTNCTTTAGVLTTGFYNNTLSISPQGNDTADLPLGSTVSQVQVYGPAQPNGGKAWVWVDSNPTPPTHSGALISWYGSPSVAQKLIITLSVTGPGAHYLHIQVAGVKGCSGPGCGSYVGIDDVVVQ